MRGGPLDRFRPRDAVRLSWTQAEPLKPKMTVIARTMPSEIDDKPGGKQAVALSGPTPGAASGATAGASSGRDRRAHHRRSTQRSWIEIDGHPCWVVDVSLGGLRFEAPNEPGHQGEKIAGELVYQDDRQMIRMPFRAEIRRVDPELDTVGLAFVDLPDESIDKLLIILSSIERAFHDARAFEQREITRQQRVAKLARWLAVGTMLALSGFIGYLVAVYA